jgi:hypothetical protein
VPRGEAWLVVGGSKGRRSPDVDGVVVSARSAAKVAAALAEPAPPAPSGKAEKCDVPKGKALVRGRRLGPLCRKLGIEFTAHVERWESNRFGSRPIYDGVLVSARSVPKLEAALAARNERSEQREAREVDRFAAAILERFPRCPPDEARRIAEHACKTGSGRVGRSATCADAVRAAVVAHVRHEHTDYEGLMEAGYDGLRGRRWVPHEEWAAVKDTARAAVRDTIDAKLAEWEGEPCN